MTQPSEPRVTARFRVREHDICGPWRYVVFPDRVVYGKFLETWVGDLDVHEVDATPEGCSILFWDTVHG